MITSKHCFWRFFAFLFASSLLLQWIIFSAVFRDDSKLINGSRPNENFKPEYSGGDEVTLEQQHLDTVDDGVAVSVMLRAPKWFHRRYTAMLHNVQSNLPPSWKIQVFFNTKWLENDVMPLHPGLKKLQRNDGILWTPLPEKMTRWKPKDIMKSQWLWENIISENVLLFGGNGALCGNTDISLELFRTFDYVGAPWKKYDGKGGDGSSHSYRHRSAMLEILKLHPPEDADQDYQYFLKHMIKSKKYKVADRATTLAFGGHSNMTPFLLSGTQTSLNWAERESLLATCPELKMIFPSLHEPTCFGAHPNGDKCKNSICALGEAIPPQGC